MKLRLLVALVCLTTAAARAAEPEKVALEYKPTAAAISYWVRSSERSGTIQLRKDAWHTVHSLGEVKQAVTATPDGKLSVAISTEAKSLMLEGKLIDTRSKPLKDTYTYVMSKRGELADPAKAAELSALASPILPAGPVAVGHSWKATVPPTKQFRLGFEISHTFEAIKDVKGAKLAVIRSVAKAKGRDETSKSTVGLTVDGTALFDIAAGAWVKSKTVTNSSVRFDKPAKNGTRMLTKGVLRVVTRREAGETAPPADK